MRHTNRSLVTQFPALILFLIAIVSGCDKVGVEKNPGDDTAAPATAAPATAPATSPPASQPPTATPPTASPPTTPAPTTPPTTNPPPSTPPSTPPVSTPPATPPPTTPPPTPAISVSVTPPAASISTQQSVQFTATVQNTTNTGVNWRVDGIPGGNANIGTISAGGLYAAPSTAGSHTITAVSNADSTKSGTASVTVTAAPPAITVTVTPTSASITTKETKQFTAQVANSTNTAVTWRVDGVQGGNTNVGTISSSGLYSPPSAAGTHTITATSVADTTKSGSATVQVTLPPVTVSVTPPTASITTQQTQQFTAQVTNATDTSVTWRVDGVQGGNATIGTISTTGLYSPPATAGTHSIIATSVADSSKSGTASVTVSAVPQSTLSGVLTYHNDNARTGQNLQESILTPSNVNSTKFGKLFSLAVDGDVYAQPLYVANISIGGQQRNVVFIATEHDSVYAFDADKGGAPLWQRSFIDPANGITTAPSADTSCGDISPELGITSTPVIDPATGALYVVAKTKEQGVHKYRLYALDITTGLDKFGPGVEIKASVPGSAKPNDSAGHLVFNAQLENQRLALLLSNGTIYFGTGSYCDLGDHHGWFFAYDAKTLSQRAAFSSTPDGTEGGIWQAGGGAAADANGNVFVITADGTFNANTGGKNYGNTFLRFASDSLAVADYFTPYNQQTLEAVNGDLGTGSPLLLPDQPGGPPHLLVAGGKQGIVYVVNRDDMGKFQAGSDSQIVQSFSGGACGPGSCSMFGSFAYFNDTVYTAAVNDGLKAYSLVAGKLAFAARSTNNYRWPGASPSISANGTNNGIVWTVESGGPSNPAVLHAHSAVNVTSELYNSNQVPGRDAPSRAKHTAPTIANGKVYVGTTGQVAVYGLLN